MLHPEKQCELLDAGIRDKTAAIYDSFKLFVQLFTALVGGSVALVVNNRIEARKFECTADALAVAIVFTCGFMIWAAHDSWHRFRLDLSRIAGKDDRDNFLIKEPGPLLWSSGTVMVMLLMMIAAASAFVTWNPLKG